MDLNLGIKTEEPRTFQVIMARNAGGVTDEGRKIIEGIKARGCDGYGCASTSGALVKRRNAAGVYLLGVQCDECGKFHSAGVKRVDHPGWASYLDYDENRRDRFYAESRQRWRDTRDAEFEAKRQDYANWLATSPEWQNMRSRVLQRAAFVCEACLKAEATQVHHTTYAAGKLPPAWLLRAVCRSCHEQIHGIESAWTALRAEHA